MEMHGYELADVVGDGRTGRVYEGTRQSDELHVALRQLRPEMAKDHGVADAIIALQAASADFRHPSLVPIVEAFSFRGAVCVVEPWIEGDDLNKKKAQGEITEEDVMSWGLDLLEALEELHDKGLAHGDISARNIIISREGPRLTGFGVAHASGRRRRTSFGPKDPFDSPELQRGEPPTPSSDLFALGTTLHKALGGGASWAMLSTDADPLTSLLMKAVSVEPRHRFKSAKEFRHELFKVSGGPRSHELRGGKSDSMLTAGPASSSDSMAGSTRASPAMTRELDALAQARPIVDPRTAKIVAGAVVVVAAIVTAAWWFWPDLPEGMLEVPAGIVSVGDANQGVDERPGFVFRHGRFFIDRTEVTAAQWQICVDLGDCTPVGDRAGQGSQAPSQPVVGVTWVEATGYCASLGKRLPSENEWEAAAQHFGGAWPWGNDEPTCNKAWYGVLPGGPCWQGGQPAPKPVEAPAHGGPAVVLEEANRPVHMAGNVWEYTLSDYAPRRGPGSGEVSPPGSGLLKVVKGGAFSAGADELRTAARLGVAMDHWAADVGFRCAAQPAR